MAPRTKPPLGGCALDGPHRLLARPGQAGLRQSWSRRSRWRVEEHAQHLPAALIRHLYAPSPPVWAVGNEGYRLFDDPDCVAMGSQPVRKLDPFAIRYLVVIVRQKIEIEAHR